MELDWTTFFLEIVNFFVLVWILQRFFYKPVQDVIARRKASIDKSLAEAESARAQAGELKDRYQKRLEDWSEERGREREKLAKELAEERARGLAALQSALEDEREKNATIERRRSEELRKDLERKAVGRGGAFAAKLVSRFSGPELEARLIGALCEDLERLPPEEARRVRDAYRREKNPRIAVASAFAAGREAREALRASLTALAGRDVEVAFSEDPGLIAGVRAELASWVLRANLRDELAFFEEAELHAP